MENSSLIESGAVWIKSECPEPEGEENTSLSHGATKEEPSMHLPYENDIDLSDDETGNMERNEVSSSSLPPVVAIYGSNEDETFTSNTDGEQTEGTYPFCQIFEAKAKYTGERPHPCPHCSYRSSTSRNLKKHLVNKHTERHFSCQYCGYKSPRSDDLKRHIVAKHTGERPFSCQHCEYKSSRSDDLKKHVMAKHTGERPHSCTYCEYKSFQSGDLKRHMMAKHTGERPYSCLYCEYKSSKSGHLRSHILAKHTDEQLYSCPHCEYKTYTSGTLRVHIKAKHSYELRGTLNT